MFRTITKCIRGESTKQTSGTSGTTETSNLGATSLTLAPHGAIARQWNNPKPISDNLKPIGQMDMKEFSKFTKDYENRIIEVERITHSLSSITSPKIAEKESDIAQLRRQFLERETKETLKELLLTDQNFGEKIIGIESWFENFVFLNELENSLMQIPNTKKTLERLEEIKELGLSHKDFNNQLIALLNQIKLDETQFKKTDWYNRYSQLLNEFNKLCQEDPNFTNPSIRENISLLKNKLLKTLEDGFSIVTHKFENPRDYLHRYRYSESEKLAAQTKGQDTTYMLGGDEHKLFAKDKQFPVIKQKYINLYNEAAKLPSEVFSDSIYSIAYQLHVIDKMFLDIIPEGKLVIMSYLNKTFSSLENLREFYKKSSQHTEKISDYFTQYALLPKENLEEINKNELLSLFHKIGAYRKKVKEDIIENSNTVINEIGDLEKLSEKLPSLAKQIHNFKNKLNIFSHEIDEINEDEFSKLYDQINACKEQINALKSS